MSRSTAHSVPALLAFTLMVGCLVSTSNSVEREGSTELAKRYGFGNLNSLNLNFSNLTNKVITCIKEDRYHPGTFFLLSQHTVRRFTPGLPVEPFIGNENQINNNYTEGNSSTAEFTVINDLVQYNKTKYALSDYLNNCVREYDSETDSVSTLIGQCARDWRTSHGELRVGEVIPGDSNFLSGVQAIELVEPDNYFIICDHGYAQVTKYDVATRQVTLITDSSILPNPVSLLVDQEGTYVYVTHSYGVSKIDLQTFEVTLLVGKVIAADNINTVPLVVGSFAESKIGALDQLTWLVADRVMVAVDLSNEAIVIIDLEKKIILASCKGDANYTTTVAGTPETCKLNSPTAVAVSRDMIYIAVLRDVNPESYGWRRETELYAITTETSSKFKISNIEKRKIKQTVGKSTANSLCPECQVQLELGSLKQVPIKSEDDSLKAISIIREDRYNPGIVYFTSGYTLMRFEPGQPPELFLGNATQLVQRYTPGNSSTAEFSLISNFLQYNRTKMLIADYLNYCIRQYDFETDYVSELIGMCGSVVTHQLKRGVTYNASTHFLVGPYIFQLAESRNMLIMVDEGFRVISQYNLVTKKVKLLGDFLQRYLPNPADILINRAETHIFVTHSNGISRVDLDSNEVTKLIGRIDADEGKVETPFVPGPFKIAQVGRPDNIRWMVPDELIVTYMTKPYELIILIDLKTERVYSACEGSNISDVTVTGGLDICELNAPTSLAVISDGTMYIATLRDGNSPADQRIFSLPSLYQMQTQVSICEFYSPTGNEIAEPPKEAYFQFEEVKVSCAAGMGLNSTSQTVQCLNNSMWNAPLPMCLKISSPDDIQYVSPLIGQISGGTKVAVVGLIPNVGGEVYVGRPGNNATRERLEFTVGGQELSFRMPSHSSVGPVEIIVKLTENVTATYEFLYTEDPVVNYTVSASTIVSGGLDVVFNVIHADSSNDYTLRADYQDYNVSCLRKQHSIYCNTKSFPGFSTTESRNSLNIELFSDGIFVVNSNSTPLLIYPDPRFNQTSISVVIGEALRLDGEHLDVGALNDDYEISIRLASGETIECEFLSATASVLTCQPDIGEHQPDSDPSDAIIRLGNLNETLVKVVFIPKPFTGLPPSSIAAIVLTVAIVFVCIIVVVTIIMRRQHQAKVVRLRLRNNSYKLCEPSGWLERLNPDLKAMLEPLLIQPDSLKIKHKDPIGEGNFGQIFLGQLYEGDTVKTVAIKTLKEMEGTIPVIEKFLEEAVILQDFRHPNVLSTLGVCIPDSEKPQVVLPYMANGDLKSLIQQENMKFTIGDLMHFAKQISHGMEYLSEHKFIHRDLAARNCLVSEKYIVRIADFGLSKDVYSTDYYRRGEHSETALPVKWLALENLQSGLFTTESDVWSYGVLLWELCTRGTHPYIDVDPWNMRAYLEEGRRLYQPRYCPHEIWNLMCGCWLTNPEDRPTFTQIGNLLNSLLEGTECVPQSSYSYIREYTKAIPNDYDDMEIDRCALTSAPMNAVTGSTLTSPRVDSNTYINTAYMRETNIDNPFG